MRMAVSRCRVTARAMKMLAALNIAMANTSSAIANSVVIAGRVVPRNSSISGSVYFPVPL
jgi:hypothetical protein